MIWLKKRFLWQPVAVAVEGESSEKTGLEICYPPTKGLKQELKFKIDKLEICLQIVTIIRGLCRNWKFDYYVGQNWDWNNCVAMVGCKIMLRKFLSPKKQNVFNLTFHVVKWLSIDKQPLHCCDWGTGGM